MVPFSMAKGMATREVTSGTFRPGCEDCPIGQPCRLRHAAWCARAARRHADNAGSPETSSEGSISGADGIILKVARVFDLYERTVGAACPGQTGSAMGAKVATGHYCTGTFAALIAISSLGGIALVITLVATLQRGKGWRAQSLLATLWATLVVMFAAIGAERIGLGIATAASSRYLHVAAIVIAPAFALGIDHLVHLSSEALYVGRLTVLVSIVLNAGWLHTRTAEWAHEANQQRRIFELISGSDSAATADQTITPVELSPNITVGLLAYLVSEHAIKPRSAVSDAEERLVRIALGLELAPEK